jgi:hypothetical protein
MLKLQDVTKTYAGKSEVNALAYSCKYGDGLLKGEAG